MRAENQRIESSSVRTENCLLAAACRSKLEKCSYQAVLWLLAAYGRDCVCVRMCGCLCGMCVTGMLHLCADIRNYAEITFPHSTSSRRGKPRDGAGLGLVWSALVWSGVGSWFALGLLSLQTLLLLLRWKSQQEPQQKSASCISDFPCLDLVRYECVCVCECVTLPLMLLFF